MFNIVYMWISPTFGPSVHPICCRKRNETSPGDGRGMISQSVPVSPQISQCMGHGNEKKYTAYDYIIYISIYIIYNIYMFIYIYIIYIYRYIYCIDLYMYCIEVTNLNLVKKNVNIYY